MTGVVTQRANHPHSTVSLAVRGTTHGVGAGEQLRNDQVQLCIGRGAQLAVFYHVGDLMAYQFRQLAVALGRQAVLMDGRQRFAHAVVDRAHGLTQSCIGCPALAGIELQRLGGFAMSMLMVAGCEAAANTSQAAGEYGSEGEDAGCRTHC